MRPLKFRAWHKQEKKMYEVSIIRFGVQHGMARGDLVDYVELDSKSSIYIVGDEIDLMQFTGLLDKRGNEIYEGDIVATGLTDEYGKYVVQFGEARTEGSDNCYAEDFYGFNLNGSTYLMDELMRGEMYIVGNFYEHPELLTKQK